MGDTINISVQFNYGLAKQIENKAEELELSKSALIRCIMLSFMGLPFEEQSRITKEEINRIKYMDLKTKKDLLQENLKSVESELKELDNPAKESR